MDKKVLENMIIMGEAFLLEAKKALEEGETTVSPAREKRRKKSVLSEEQKMALKKGRFQTAFKS